MGIQDMLQKIHFRSERIVPAVITSLFLSFTILFFGPSYFYFGNVLEIPYLYSDFVWIFVTFSLATGTILSIFLLFLKEKLHQRAVVFVFVLGILLWIQGHILVWDYGPLDGREIIWSAYLLNGIIDSTIWIVILGIALWKAESLYKSVTVACIFLILVQAGGLAIEAYTAPQEPAWKYASVSFNDTARVEFSEQQNVIIIVLDAYRSDIFQEIINEDESYRDIFDGFTYYRNAAGGYAYTDASIPLLLTGEYYDNSVPRSDFVKGTFLNNSIPRLLKESGYRTDLYSIGGGLEETLYINNETASNAGDRSLINPGERTVDIIDGAMDMQRLTLFRHLPHFFKSYFHFMPFIGSKGQGDIPYDLAFYNTLVSTTSTTDEEKIFKFYHTFGPHPPLILNSKLYPDKLPFNHTGYEEQAKASLKISGELIQQLKNNHVYDKSLIFIVGDHGANHQAHGVKSEINTNLLDKKISSSYDYDNQKIVESGIPLVLVKRFNSTGDLVISDAPVSTSDIPQTIASELNLSNTFSGQSIFSINESDIRVRKYFHYLLEGQPGKYYLDLGYLPPMREYKIIGHSWDVNSWEPTVNVFEPGKGLAPLPDYKINTKIFFGKNGTAEVYQLGGWASPENNFTWTDAHHTTLAVKILKPKSDLSMKISVSPYLNGSILAQQRVTVLVNGKSVGMLIFDKPGFQEKNITIPNSVLDDEIQNISFELPDAISPKKIGQSEDYRDLALAFRSFEIISIE